MAKKFDGYILERGCLQLGVEKSFLRLGKRISGHVGKIHYKYDPLRRVLAQESFECDF